MRKSIVAAVVALSLAGVGAGALIAEAQPAPPPRGPEAGAPWGGPMHHHPEWRRWMHHMREGHGPMRGPGTFALVYRHDDRQLTPPDVQKIAEAFLLWQGNHTWKVVDVVPAQDGAIGFALATQEGSVVARFTMDPHSGQVKRVG
jgi:hypothetical protein